MPSHLKTYNLSLLDRIVPNTYTDFVFHYPKYMNNVNTNVLKQSLSQSLAIYYPLEGRLPSPSASYVDLNDEGIDFVEVSTDSRLSEFIVKKYHDETLHHLFPHGLGLNDGKTNRSLLQVQLNHFSDGGVAVAVSVSHKIADGLSVASFVNHWATVARGESPIDPTFISSPASNSTEVIDEYDPEYTSNVLTCAATKMKNPGQMQLNEMVNELRKRKMKVKGLTNMKEAAQYLTNMLSTLDQGCVYTVTSLCTFPFYNANFGWGKPLKVAMDIPEYWVKPKLFLRGESTTSAVANSQIRVRNANTKEDETIDAFTTKLTTLVNKAASLGHTMEDETLVRKLLNAVPDRYLQIVASIEQYSDLSEMTFEEAIGRLKTYEERIRYKGKQVDNQDRLLFTRYEEQGRKRGHGESNQSRGQENNFKKETHNNSNKLTHNKSK
nr:acylsugar acyltransferase 3-like [Tanacetum cinerariifolium]